MRRKSYKLRGRTIAAGKTAVINLELEFDGKRAFVVWDSMNLGNFLLKARIEIDPELLQKEPGCDWDFLYRGELVLPRPELN
jgi:hypothetical protein